MRRSDVEVAIYVATPVFAYYLRYAWPGGGARFSGAPRANVDVTGLEKHKDEIYKITK